MRLNRRNMLAFGAAIPALVLAGNASWAQSEPSFYAERGVAIDGTDPVAYFTEGKPVAGDPALTHEWMGSTWRFASAENRDRFVANPAAYAPQYGGYCAWAVSRGYTASTVPEAWEIVEGKLYLNYSLRVKKHWSQDIPGNIARGDANWPDVLG